MDKLKVRGGNPLRGTVQISGSKNAALPILISSLLTEERCIYSHVPVLQDIHTTLKLLKHLGSGQEGEFHNGEIRLSARVRADGQFYEAPYDLVRKMRASVLVLGPLLTRFGRAKVSLPGGCAIGARPIGFHLMGLEKLGAQIKLEGGYVFAEAQRLRGARIHFDYPSVGATENLMMAAALAQGETLLENCAREPEIVDLAGALEAMGAQIEGAGTKAIQIQGKDSLRGCQYGIMGDRIEAGTFLAAAFATQGEVRVEGISPVYLEAVLRKFEEAGAQIERGDQSITLKAPRRPLSVDVATEPYPGFPTDMQAQFMAVMAVAGGESRITETVFENRFMHVSELARLGVDVQVRGNTAIVHGKSKLWGAPLMATDLRASACLVLAALCAEGESTVNRIYHLDRGYEAMEKKLAALGADVHRTS